MRDNRLVYSTDTGRLCPLCGKMSTKCTCKRKKSTPPAPNIDGTIRIQRETKGRKGKTVTAIYGLDPKDANLKQIATRLKSCCGSGGSVKNGTIIIQGDHRETVKAQLTQAGFTVKLAGG